MKHIYIIILSIIFFGCKKASLTNPSTKSGGNTTNTNPTNFDIVIYGGTSAGVVAAIQAARLNKSVALIVNTSRLGGMTTGGLGNTDIGNSKVIGGLALEFYKKVATLYGTNTPQWLFEPHVALQAFNQMLDTSKIKIFYNNRLLAQNAVTKVNSAISSIQLESGVTLTGKMFIDCSYEGDLMAETGVSFIVGREANSTYNETLNGVTSQTSIGAPSPYTTTGNSSSGYLPRINSVTDDVVGTADNNIMAYNYRVTLSDRPSNMVPILKPQAYNALEYELLIRALQKDSSQSVSTIIPLPNHKFDMNANGAFSSDYIGMSKLYPNADYATRATIASEHQTYIQGLLWTLQNDPRIPITVRVYYNTFGLAKDEFTENNNWPTQLYVREARRMVGYYVNTERDVKSETQIINSIGMGSYNIDCHFTQFVIDKNSKLGGEGQISLPVAKPYLISYFSILPKRTECTNLFVPVCLSSSHVAFCSIRLEPQYMILAQSAATAASLCIDNNVAAQDLDYTKLKSQLTLEKQVIN